MDIRKISDRVSVSPQIAVEDIEAIKAAGFTTVVNNRPDGEAPDQPRNADIEAAAKAAGLGYKFIPMGREGVSPEMIASTRAALEGSEGPVLCYCRSGTRSATLWALSQAGRIEAEEIVAAASAAGYDLSHLLGHLGR